MNYLIFIHSLEVEKEFDIHSFSRSRERLSPLTSYQSIHTQTKPSGHVKSKLDGGILEKLETCRDLPGGCLTLPKDRTFFRIARRTRETDQYSSSRPRMAQKGEYRLGPSDIPDTPGAYSSTFAIPPLRLRRTGVNNCVVSPADGSIKG